MYRIYFTEVSLFFNIIYKHIASFLISGHKFKNVVQKSRSCVCSYSWTAISLLHHCWIDRPPPRNIASSPHHLLLVVILQIIVATLHSTCWTQQFLQYIHWEILKHTPCCLSSKSSTWELAISTVMGHWKGAVCDGFYHDRIFKPMPRWENASAYLGIILKNNDTLVEWPRDI